jgi:hypothetical protein
LCRLLFVHNRVCMGLPLVWGSTRFFRASVMLGWWVWMFFREYFKKDYEQGPKFPPANR